MEIGRDIVRLVLTALALVGLLVVVAGLFLVAMFSPKDGQEKPPDEDRDRTDD